MLACDGLLRLIKCGAAQAGQVGQAAAPNTNTGKPGQPKQQQIHNTRSPPAIARGLFVAGAARLEPMTSPTSCASGDMLRYAYSSVALMRMPTRPMSMAVR